LFVFYHKNKRFINQDIEKFSQKIHRHSACLAPKKPGSYTRLILIPFLNCQKAQGFTPSL